MEHKRPFFTIQPVTKEGFRRQTIHSLDGIIELWDEYCKINARPLFSGFIEWIKSEKTLISEKKDNQPMPQDTQKTEEWEKEFDDEFLYWVVLGSTLNDGSKQKWNVRDGEMPDFKKIKRFISKAISQSKSDTRREIREEIIQKLEIQKNVLEKSREIVVVGRKKTNEMREDRDVRNGMIIALKDVLSLPSLKVAEEKDNK